MKAKDLKIGNFVEVNGAVSRVVSISENEKIIEVKTPQNAVQEVSLANVKPVLLSSNVLTDSCDFDRNGMHVLGLDEHRYFLKIENGYIVLLNKDEEPLIHFWDIKSLHALQNLYYALKGQELNVNFQ